MENSSAELVIRLQKGEQAAFEKLFELHKVKAVRTAYFLTSNRTLAEDIMQEAFVKCYLKINTLKDPMQFQTWFFKTLTRIAWKMSKKEKAIIPVENIYEIADYEAIEQVEVDIIKKETAENMMLAIDNLDYKQKTTVLLYYYNQFSVTEIASIMDCFEGTVKSRLHTARKNLRRSQELQQAQNEEEMKDAVIHKI